MSREVHVERNVGKHGAKGTHPSFIAGQVRGYRYFFLNLVPQKKGLTVACGGWERCEPDYRVQRSDFAFYGMEYVAKGRGVLTLNGREHQIMPGSLFVYQPFTAHTIQTDPADPLVKYFVDFSGHDARRIIGRKVLGAQGIAYLNDFQPVHDLYEQMLDAGLKGGYLAQRLCGLLLEMISVRVEEHAHAPADAKGRARQAFDRCRDELRKHFCTIQSVSELARLTHLDPAYIARLFARFGEESPYEMLIRLKVNEAAALVGGPLYSQGSGDEGRLLRPLSFFPRLQAVPWNAARPFSVFSGSSAHGMTVPLPCIV